MIELKVHVRDLDHFYRIVRWLNSNIGRGQSNWTMRGRARRSILRGDRNLTILINSDINIEESCGLYLSLI